MAQERPLDNRERAAVGFNAPVEGLSVSGPGRYYPAEYSPQIAALGKQTEAISRIPESLARIIEYADEYKINAYSNREQAELYKAELKSEMYKDTLALDSANRVNDKSLQLKEALAKAKVASEESNGDIPLTEAYQEVFNSDEFRNPAEFTSLNSQKNWQAIYNRTQEEYSIKALETDIFNTRAEMDMHIGQAINVIYRNASTTGIYPTENLDQFNQTIYPYRGHVTAKNLAKHQNDAWESATLGYANYILGKAERYAADPSDPLGLKFEDAETALRELLDDCVYKRLGYADDGTGRIIKDPDGQGKVFTVSLSSQVQDEIEKNIKILRNKQQGTGVGDTAVASIYQGLMKELKLPENLEIDTPLELKDVLKGMQGKSRDDLLLAIGNYLEGVQNSPASPATKNKYLEKGVQLLGAVDTLAAARDLMTASGDPDTARLDIGLFSQAIDNGLRSGKPIAAWLPSIAVGDKKFIPNLESYRLKYGIPEQINGAFVERQYLENVANACKTLSEMDADNLLTYLNPDLYAASNTLGVVDSATGRPVSVVDSRNIIEGLGTAAPRINPKEVEKAAADITQVLGGVKKYGGNYLSDESIMKRAKAYNADNPLGGMFAAEAFIAASASDSLEKFAANSINSGKNDEKAVMSRNITKGMLIVADADTKTFMCDFYSKFPSDELRKNEYDKAAKQYSVEDARMQLRLSQYKIPGVYRPAVESLAQDLLAARGERKDAANLLDKVIKNNFVKVDHVYNGEMVYKNSPVLKSWGGAENVRDINSCFKQVHAATKNGLGINVDFVPNYETGTFEIMVGGQPFSAPVRMHTPRSLKIPAGSPRSVQAIANITNLDVATSYLIGDKTAREKLVYDNNGLLNSSGAGYKNTPLAQKQVEFDKTLRGLKVSLLDDNKVRKAAKNYVQEGIDPFFETNYINWEPSWEGNRLDIAGLRTGQRSIIPFFGDNSFVHIGHPEIVQSEHPHGINKNPMFKGSTLSHKNYSDGRVISAKSVVANPYLQFIMTRLMPSGPESQSAMFYLLEGNK